jgi:hypothetical protein
MNWILEVEHLIVIVLVLENAPIYVHPIFVLEIILLDIVGHLVLADPGIAFLVLRALLEIILQRLV